MKLQTLLSAALLLTAVPAALAEEPARAVAQPIEAFEDVIVSAGLYDSGDDEEDSYDMEDVAKKDSKKSDKKKKKSKKSGRKNRNRRSNRNNPRRRRKGMCRNPKGRSDRDLCDELEDRFCSGSRRNKQNRQLCRDLGFRRSVTDEEWTLIDTEEFLPEEYDMLIDDVAEDIDDSSMDSEDSEDSYSYDDEDDSGDEEEDSEDLDSLLEKDKGGGSKKKTSKKKTSKKKTSKKDSKKKKSNKKSKKSNKRSNKRSSRSSSSSSRSSRSCFDRSSRSSCKDTSRCEWFKTSTGGFCIEASSSSSDYDFAEE